MKHKFTIPNLPDSNFEIEVSFWINFPKKLEKS